MANISKAKAQEIRTNISKYLQDGLSHDDIISKLDIDRSTFYRYLKGIRDIETRIWSKVEIDSARYRGLALLRSFEDTVRICTAIAQSNGTSNKDRIEACKARDMANAHILRLVSEGTMFRHLPEVKVYMDRTTIDNKDNNIINNNKLLDTTSFNDHDDVTNPGDDTQ